VYVLEKVLKIKKGTSSQASFLDEALMVGGPNKPGMICNCCKVLDDKPSTAFWGILARALEKQARDAAKGTTHEYHRVPSNNRR
jgi:hypothetical protein